MIPNLASALRVFPASGKLLAAAVALQIGAVNAADVQRGGSIYTSHCVMCHGPNGQPVMPGTPNLRRLESLTRPDMQLMLAIRNGRGAMPGYFGVLREREIMDVVAYLRTLN